jgi:uncharacterized Fe-S cluster-containing radical SAM superfamily protein
MSDQIKQWIAKGYALEVTEVIIENDKAEDLDQETLLLDITNAALENMKDDIVPFVNPILTEEQVNAVIDSAAKAQLRNTISEMVDAGLIDAELSESGEVLYKATAKGAAYEDMLEDGFIKPEDFTKQLKEGKL